MNKSERFNHNTIVSTHGSCDSHVFLCVDAPCLWTTPGVSWLEPLCVWSSTIACSLPTAYRGLRGTHSWPRRVAWCQNLNTSLWLVKTRSDRGKNTSKVNLDQTFSGAFNHVTWSSSADGVRLLVTEMDQLTWGQRFQDPSSLLAYRISENSLNALETLVWTKQS